MCIHRKPSHCILAGMGLSLHPPSIFHEKKVIYESKPSKNSKNMNPRWRQVDSMLRDAQRTILRGQS